MKKLIFTLCFVLLTASAALAHISTLGGSTGFKTIRLALMGDWANWDATSDGTIQRFFTDDGLSGPSSITALDQTYSIGFVRYRGSPEARYAALWSRSGTVMALEDTLGLSDSTVGTFSAAAALSDTRAIGTFGTDSEFKMFLIGRSGNTLSELDAETCSATVSSVNGAHHSIQRLTNTKAILWFRDSTVRKATVVDVSGDTISCGTVTTASNASGSGNGTLRVISETEFIAADTRYVYYFTVSGDTITESAVLDLASGNGFLGIFQANKSGSKYALLSYNPTGTATTCHVVNYTGSSIGSLASNVISTTDLVVALPEQRRVENANPTQGTGLFSIVHQSDAESIQTAIVTVDGSNVCSLGTWRETMKGDHPVIERVPVKEGQYIIQISQDMTTTPTDQLSIKVIQADLIERPSESGGGGGGSYAAMDTVIATAIADYPASQYTEGTTWSNVAATGTDYDLFLGAAGTVDGDEPTHNGSGTGAYWTFDGSSQDFQETVAPPAALADWVKSTGSDITVAVALRTPSAASVMGVYRLFESSSYYVRFFIDNSSKIRLQFNSGGTITSYASTASLATSTDYCLVMSLDRSTGNFNVYINSATPENLTGTLSYSGTPAGGDTVHIGSIDTAWFWPSDARLYRLSLVNDYITDEQATSIFDQLSVDTGIDCTPA